MITSEGLKKLGFEPDKDFNLQDDGDGVVYIKDWISSQPQPTESEIEYAYAEWKIEYSAEQDAKVANLASVKIKLSNLGLTTDEVKEAFGI